MYVEYTNALAVVLKEKPLSNPAQVFETVKSDYSRRFNLQVMPPLGFNNSFAIVMRGNDARQMHVQTLSQLAAVAPKLHLAVGYEFMERPDGYQGLVSTYGLKFAETPRVMDLGLLYRAIESRQVDVAVGSNTDGLIAALGLVVLENGPAPISRPMKPCRLCGERRWSAIHGRPGSVEADRRITAEDMRQMNYAVDGEKKDAADVVKKFIQAKKLS